MAKIISISGKSVQYFHDLKSDDFENELPLLHINADCIIRIHETVVKKQLGDKEIEKNIRCIVLKGRMHNIYTNESIDQIIDMVNS